MLGAVRQVIQDIHSFCLRYFRTRAVVKVLKTAHAVELSETPGELWPVVRQKHSEALAAVKAGKFDIVDRRSLAFPYLPECASEDSEILTKRGWISVQDMEESDFFASRSFSGRFEWRQAENITKSWYEGPMLHFKAMGVDHLVTPNHRLYGRDVLRKRDVTFKGEHRFVSASELVDMKRYGRFSNFQVPITCNKWRGSFPVDGRHEIQFHGVKVDLKDWVAFIGIFLAEGCTSGALYGAKFNRDGHESLREAAIAAESKEKSKAKFLSLLDDEQEISIVEEKHYLVRISQVKKEPKKKIRELLKRLPFRFAENERDFECGSEVLWKTLHPLGNTYTKFIPEWMKELPKAYLQELLDWMVLGDGHVYGDFIEYATSSEKLADDVQEICQKLGRYASKSKRPFSPGEAPAFRLHIGTKKYAGVGKPITVDYKGYVYCPTVPPYSTILVRRNGKACWTGNSLHRLGQPILKATPYNARRFGETPIPRRAINLIKNALLALKWELVVSPEYEKNPERQKRIEIGTRSLKHPNNSDTFDTLMEAVIEDTIVGGYGTIEPAITQYYKRPFKLWAVDGCYSEDTEVLTSQGWQRWPDVEDGEIFATRSESGEFEWQQADAIYRKDFDGELLRFKSNRIDLKVTSNHDLYVRKLEKKNDKRIVSDLQFVEAEEVASFEQWPDGSYPFRAPLTSHWKGKIPRGKKVIEAEYKTGPLKTVFKVERFEVDWRDWAAFLGLYVAEGSVLGTMRGVKAGVNQSHYVEAISAAADVRPYGNNYQVHIAQRKENRHYKDIAELLARLPFGFVEGQGGFRCGCKSLYWELAELGNKYTKFVPNEIKELSKEYLNIFIDWACKGDGCSREMFGKTIRWYGTVSKKLADDMQELFQKVGTSATTFRREEEKRKVFGGEYFCSPYYWVQEKVQGFGGIGKCTRVPYKGKVYCASVKNRTLFVRRNGYPVWCGNSTVRIYGDWTESHPERAHYAQMVGFKGEAGIVNFRDDELIYIRDNVRTNTPFGLGKLEVAFNSINAFLGVQDMSGRAGADQIHKTWLWWKKPQSAGHIQTVIRHTQNEGEGQAKISFMSGMEAPDVLDVKAVQEQDLLLGWQEFLIRIIAQAFDLTPFALGLEKDVNRNTSETMSTQDFRSAVKPMARRFETAITMGIFHRLLGWKDIEFRYIGLDDPDVSTLMDIFTKEDAVDAITPDEIRKARGRQPIEGGFGRLTKTQRELLLYETRFQKEQNTQAAQEGQTGMGLGARLPMPGTMFSAKDVAEMKPDKIKDLQKMKLLPQTQELKKKMEDQEPGVLERISEELQDFFEAIEKEDSDEVQPEKVKPADEQEQQAKFRKAQKKEKLPSSHFDKFSDEDIVGERKK